MQEVLQNASRNGYGELAPTQLNDRTALKPASPTPDMPQPVHDAVVYLSQVVSDNGRSQKTLLEEMCDDVDRRIQVSPIRTPAVHFQRVFEADPALKQLMEWAEDTKVLQKGKSGFYTGESIRELFGVIAQQPSVDEKPETLNDVELVVLPPELPSEPTIDAYATVAIAAEPIVSAVIIEPQPDPVPVSENGHGNETRDIVVITAEQESSIIEEEPAKSQRKPGSSRPLTPEQRALMEAGRRPESAHYPDGSEEPVPYQIAAVINAITEAHLDGRSIDRKQISEKTGIPEKNVAKKVNAAQKYVAESGFRIRQLTLPSDFNRGILANYRYEDIPLSERKPHRYHVSLPAQRDLEPVPSPEDETQAAVPEKRVELPRYREEPFSDEDIALVKIFLSDRDGIEIRNAGRNIRFALPQELAEMCDDLPDVRIIGDPKAVRKEARRKLLAAIGEYKNDPSYRHGQGNVDELIKQLLDVDRGLGGYADYFLGLEPHEVTIITDPETRTYERERFWNAPLGMVQRLEQVSH